MERALQAMLEDMERSGPEGVGAPVRGVTVLASELAEIMPVTRDPLARRRRRASAARLARRALSLATDVHGVIGDRPDAARAWSWNARELDRRGAAPRPARGGGGGPSGAGGAAPVRAGGPAPPPTPPR